MRNVAGVVILLCCSLMLLACSRAIKAPEDVQGDTRVHDPSLIRQGNSYYVFSTGDERGLNQGNIQIRRSHDLANWERIGTVFTTQPAWIAEELGSTPPNLWAPDISYFNGTYHLYYAGSRFGSNHSVIGLATNTTLDPADPNYAWVDQGLVTRSLPAFRWNAIDPNLSVDGEGQTWLAFGSFWDGIRMLRIDSATGKPSEVDTTLYALASRGGGPIEAPAIIARDGFYYLFVSFDLCCRGITSTYKIMVGRSQQITGPYLDREGRELRQGGGTLLLEGHDPDRGPGGQSVYLDNGVYRLVYHVYDTRSNGLPQLRIRDLSWDNDGWPSITAP